jgi:hypothetical protein
MKNRSEIQEDKKIHRKEGRYPLTFLLEMKDIVAPIIIKRIQIVKAVTLVLLISASAFAVWYYFLKAPAGNKLVDQMVAAAGGMDTWNKINRGTFKRTHHLYSEAGDLLSERMETFYFEKNNGRVEFMVDANRPGNSMVTIGKDKEGFWAVENNRFVDARQKARELGMMCESEWCQPNCDMTMAFYRFSMPFKLKDDGVIAKNAGESIIDSKKSFVLDITYRPDVGKDRWIFHVDQKEKVIRKMEYHHHTDQGKDLPEEFYWTDHKEIGGLVISRKWTRYRSNGKVLEEYIFSDFDFKSELPLSFHKRRRNML